MSIQINPNAAHSLTFKNNGASCEVSQKSFKEQLKDNFKKSTKEFNLVSTVSFNGAAGFILGAFISLRKDMEECGFKNGIFKFLKSGNYNKTELLKNGGKLAAVTALLMLPIDYGIHLLVKAWANSSDKPAEKK